MQQITVYEQKGAAVTEVKDVLSFSDKEIKLVVGAGNRRLAIEGAGLKITGFVKEKGEFAVEGNVTSVKYLGAKENVLKKVFK